MGFLIDGEVTNCRNETSGDLLAIGDKRGGICGAIAYESKVSQCCNTGNIGGIEAIGGIAGVIYGGSAKVLSCYNTGKIRANNSEGLSKVGGLIR